MVESLSKLVLMLNSHYVGWALLAASAVLILIDYYFPTDWPARLAYVCCGAASFLFLPLDLLASAVGGVLIWLMLEVLHRVWLRHILQNAPGATLGGSSERKEQT